MKGNMKNELQFQKVNKSNNNNNSNALFQTAKQLKMTYISNQQELDLYMIHSKNKQQAQLTDHQQDQQNKDKSQSTYSLVFPKQNISTAKEEEKVYAAKQSSGLDNKYDKQKQYHQQEQILYGIKDKQQRTILTAKSSKQKQQYFMKLQRAKEMLHKQLKEQKSLNPSANFAVDYSLAKSQKQIVLKEKYKLYFPYQPYQIQIEYMNKVITTLQNKCNAILQSPTGTGKTICLLASVLSFVQMEYKKDFTKTKIIFMSRTHSQLSQIQKQLSKTCYRPNMAVFGSREQLCVKEELKFLKGKEKIEACGKGVKMATKYRKNLPQNVDQKLQQVFCRYYRQKQQVFAIQKQQLAHKLLNVKIMKQKGEQLSFCPYFYPSDVKHLSTLFLMPYNYILDSFLMSLYKQMIQDSILIFDEAHNVPEAACEGRSIQMQSSNLQMAILQLNKILSSNISYELTEVKQKHQKQIKFMLTKLQNFQQTFRQFIKQNLFQNQSSNRQSFRQDIQSKMINKQRTDFMIYELFYGPIADERNKQFTLRKQFYFKEMKTKILNPLQQFSQYGIELIEELKETVDGKSMNFQRVVIFCKKIHDLMKPFVYTNNHIKDEHEVNHYRLNISKKNSPINSSFTYTIGLTCLMPFLTFQQLKKFKPKSIILTSGTLKPLQTWQKQLQLQFKQQLINDHVISKEQLIAKIIKKGCTDSLLNFSYENLNRNRDRVYKDLIQFIVDLSKRVPNGILVVFPSFKIQSDFKYFLNISQKKQQLFSYKDVIYQQKGVDFDMKNFKKKSQSKKGVILMIICRGKVSQGMDFPDGMCRAVIMVGIPWPNVKDPFIVEKKNHLQDLAAKSVNKSQALRGNEWYTVGTIRAINQALGRVIRHALDYGSIFLVDSRYSQQQFMKQFPSWVRGSLEVVQKVNTGLLLQIENFFSEMKIKYKPKVNTSSKYEYEQEYAQKPKEKPTNAFDALMKKNDKKQKYRRQRSNKSRWNNNNININNDQTFDF